MHRFYYPHKTFEDTIEITDKEEIHHIKNVLRLKAGGTIHIFNNGGSAKGTISKISTKHVEIQIEEIQKRFININRPTIILACAIPKRGKFELIIEKATEMGVDEIIPLQTKRTEVIIKEKQASSKMKRFQSVAVNAAKQSQRDSVTIIHESMELSKAVEWLKPNTTLITPSLTDETKNLLVALSELENCKRIAFFIGPEGDFTPFEYKLMLEAGSTPVNLGETVLKVETAAICAIACANLHFSK